MSNYKFVVNPAYGQYSDFVGRLPRCFDTEGELVYEGRNIVKLFNVNGQTLVVKQYKRPLFHQRIDYTFIRKSKARRAYDYALRFLECGIDTPDAVACVEEYKYGLFRTGFFVSAYCGDPDLRVLREKPEDALIEAFAAFVVRMHEKGIMHGDLNLSNVLYREDANGIMGYHFTMIDINRSKFISVPSQRQCLRNMVRISHDRALNAKIMACYAGIRGWNKEECVAKVERMLDIFEKKRSVKRKIKFKKNN
jgi:tRNA A-37 threonylcarbamoyl transferase component Bud32